MTTATRVCDTCHEAAPLAAFQKMGRGYRTTCEPCRQGPAPAAEPEPEDRLEMAPGFGFQAHTSDGNLTISQADRDGNLDTVILSRTEAKVLFSKYQEWADA